MVCCKIRPGVVFICLFVLPARTIGGNISPTEMVNICNLAPLFICSPPLELPDENISVEKLD